MNEYLYIFVHVPKTGGSTFRKHIEKNIPADQRWVIDYNNLRLGFKKSPMRALDKAIKEEISSFSHKRMDNIRVIYGHMVPYGIHKYFKKIPRYIIFVRHPERRILSLFNYFMTRFHRDLEKGVNDPAYKYQVLVLNKLPGFEAWIKDKYGQPGKAVETTLQHLKNLGYLNNVYKKSEYRKALNRFYYIGITRYLNEDLNYLYWKMGFTKFFVNQNISHKYVKSFKNYKEVETILDRNIAFFNLAVKKRNKIINRLNAHQPARIMGIKRRILQPVTQLLFDFKGYAIETSAALRSKHKIYSKIYDLIRGYRKK